MTDAIPHKFICECGSILTNHYPAQIVKHRRSRKHALKLMDIINEKEKKEIVKIKEKEKKGSIIMSFD
jgi:hypothetical protein